MGSQSPILLLVYYATWHHVLCLFPEIKELNTLPLMHGPPSNNVHTFTEGQGMPPGLQCALMQSQHIPWLQVDPPRWVVGGLCLLPTCSDQLALLPPHPGDCFWSMLLLWQCQATPLLELPSPCLQLFCLRAFWTAWDSLDDLQRKKEPSHSHFSKWCKVTNSPYTFWVKMSSFPTLSVTISLCDGPKLRSGLEWTLTPSPCTTMFHYLMLVLNTRWMQSNVERALNRIA